MNSGNLKILLVEDNEGDARLAKEHLLEKGFKKENIVHANTLENAKTQIELIQFDAILLDLGLPDSKREETVNNIFEIVDNVPVIILSGNHDEITAIDSVKSGVQEYLVKGDFTSIALQRCIKNAIIRSKTEQELKELIKFKDNLISILSHDLRSPFNALIGYIDFTLDELETINKNEIKANLFEIKSISFTLLHFIENLLMWSRMQSNKITVSPDLFSLDLLKEKSLAILNVTAGSKNIKINAEGLDSKTVFADIDMIDTVLRNLIGNAIKFSPENSEIKIKSYDGPLVKIEVIDQGFGMDKKDIKNLLNSSEVTSKLGTRREKGYGLGLLICKEFIELNNGKIRIESEINKGTKIELYLPKNDKVNNEDAVDSIVQKCHAELDSASLSETKVND